MVNRVGQELLSHDNIRDKADASGDVGVHKFQEPLDRLRGVQHLSDAVAPSSLREEVTAPNVVPGKQRQPKTLGQVMSQGRLSDARGAGDDDPRCLRNHDTGPYAWLCSHDEDVPLGVMRNAATRLPAQHAPGCICWRVPLVSGTVAWMTSDAFSVRVALPEDSDFVREMARHAATLEDRPLPAADAQDVAELVPTHIQHALVAVSHSGRRAGAAWFLVGGVALVPALASAPEVCMALSPESRSQGLGTVLLKALIKRSAASGESVLVLNVHLRNTAALCLYMKCGFRVAGTGRGWFGVAMARSER